jgi:hypothetical protein
MKTLGISCFLLIDLTDKKGLISQVKFSIDKGGALSTDKLQIIKDEIDKEFDKLIKLEKPIDFIEI